MSDDISVVRRKAYRYFLRDGIMGIHGGLFLAFYAGLSDYVASDFQTNFPAMPLAIFFAFSGIMIETIRRRVTYPRIGYARMTAWIGLPFLLATALPMVLFQFVLAISVSFFKDAWDIAPILKWSPAFFGVALAVTIHGIAMASGYKRLYALCTISVILGAVLTLLAFGTAGTVIVAFFLTMGGLLFSWGLAAFIQFVRSYRKAPAEESSGT